MTNHLDRRTDPFANEWCFPRQARHMSHGRILPMEDGRPGGLSPFGLSRLQRLIANARRSLTRGGR